MKVYSNNQFTSYINGLKVFSNMIMMKDCVEDFYVFTKMRSQHSFLKFGKVNIDNLFSFNNTAIALAHSVGQFNDSNFMNIQSSGKQGSYNNSNKQDVII